MLPAYQRLDAHDRTRLQIHPRLVMQDEFPSLQGVAQAVFEDCRSTARMFIPLEELVGVAPSFLRVVHRGIRVLQQRLRIRPVLRVSGDAYACGKVQLVLVDVVGRAQRHRILSALTAASSACVTSESKITNSSPPCRLTVSELRTQATNRCATDCSKLSPIAWPSESLMCLNRSMSRNSTASSFR